jgi:polysaccharide biosynthesis/export protein
VLLRSACRFAACIALLVPLFAGAQDTRALGAPGPAASGGAALPQDLRVGASRPSDSQDTGSMPRTASSPLLAVTRDYKVGPNDLLEIEVLDFDNLKRTVRVNAAGVISLPLIAAVPVAGLTSQQIEERIADRYREKYLQNPQVSVFIKEFTTERITVEGAVAKPGIYPLTGQFTLLRALALAGGFGPIANSSEVIVFRNSEDGKRQATVFDVEQIRAGKQDDPAIRGDDLIVVQRDAARRMLKDSILRDVLDSVNPFSFLARP